MLIKKGDTVYIRSGQDKGTTGKVLHVDNNKNRVLVEGVNMRKKHQRPTDKNPKGGIITIEAPVNMSNVALYSSSLGGPTKVTTKVITESGRKRRIRICRKTGEEI
ncbi:MAG: 50S ribosomal protein L24 [candidate division Zixibacteria bacterium]|nr:50S ribosomal protein L24 [candidate division Zixibacteria bacterium]